MSLARRGEGKSSNIVSDTASTVGRVPSRQQLRRMRALRRVGISVLTLIVLAAAVGVFGIRTGTATASQNGYSMRLDYPAVDRAGQPIHWALTLHHAGGFSAPIGVGITQSYLDLLDVNAINPQPSASRNVGDLVVWSFAPPQGDVLRVSMDAFVQLNAHLGADADVAVLQNGSRMVGVHYRTWVAP
ncbi:MAG: hypothetical protein ABR579_11095 [Actinomycetota bacterium]